MRNLLHVSSDDFSHDAPSVLLLLHGYGSHENDLTGLIPALNLPMPWASLRAPIDLAGGGAAWFEITTPGVPDPAPIAAATDAIWSWIDAHLSPETRIVPIGFSQGGLMASQLLRTRPDRIDLPVILGGFILGGEQPADEILAASQPRVFWGRGADDQVIAAAAIARTSDWLPIHSTLSEHIYPGLGHGVSAAEITDVRVFLST
ncbi:MAG: alpha/beta hydrolase [Leucobacter sp.]